MTTGTLKTNLNWQSESIQLEYFWQCRFKGKSVAKYSYATKKIKSNLIKDFEDDLSDRFEKYHENLERKRREEKQKTENQKFEF